MGEVNEVNPFYLYLNAVDILKKHPESPGTPVGDVQGSALARGANRG